MSKKITKVISCLSVLLILGWGFCAYAKSNSSDETGQTYKDNSDNDDDSHSGDSNSHDGSSGNSDHDNSGDSDDSHSGGNGNSDNDSDNHEGDSGNLHDGDSNDDEGDDDSSQCCPKPSPVTFTFKDSSGLGASAKVSVGNDQIVIELMNTSLGVPSGFSNSDQLLTSFAFSLPAGTAISGGSVVIGKESYSVNFSEVQVQLGSGADVSTEWGYGNLGNTGFESHLNFISSMTSHTTPFLSIPPGTNLDKSVNLGGPEGGLTNGVLPVEGIGAIYNSITSYLTISGIDLTNNCDTTSLLSYLKENGAIFEFGSDAYFGDSQILPPPPPPDDSGSTNPVPEPSTFLLITVGFLGLIGFLKKKNKG
ncbi:MAG: PEP-CTERM sorting domain-containing protein [Candidatus Schekmanbacteria bacterium]|nr:PEP-CTERM sorting domain-containing protein [Candidatus Schekmanbacteria bacterium]